MAAGTYCGDGDCGEGDWDPWARGIQAAEVFVYLPGRTS